MLGLRTAAVMMMAVTMAAVVVVLSADEELARVRDVHRHVAVHGMLAQQVDAKLLARFREPPLAVQRDDVREDAAGAVVLHKLEELAGEVVQGRGKLAVLRLAVVVVDAGVLVVQGAVEQPAAETLRIEHALDKGAELDVAVVQLRRDGALELQLDGLEAADS